MRMSRWEWLAQYFKFRPRTKVQREKRERKANLPARYRIERIDCGDRVLFVEAPTRSEARALAKKELGIGRKGRLPVGAKVTRLQ